MRENLRDIGNLFFAWLKRSIDAQSAFFLLGLGALWWGIFQISPPASFIAVGSIIVVLSTWGVFKR